MSEKPSYLGLLNAISVAETEAECYLNAWAEATDDDGVRQVIATVALREGEHGKAFAKRICELGYSVLPRDNSQAAAKLAIAASRDLTDREKFEKLDLSSTQDSSSSKEEHRHPDWCPARALHRRGARQRTDAAGVLRRAVPTRERPRQRPLFQRCRRQRRRVAVTHRVPARATGRTPGLNAASVQFLISPSSTHAAFKRVRVVTRRARSSAVRLLRSMLAGSASMHGLPPFVMYVHGPPLFRSKYTLSP
jgi:hypothetical protein